MGALEEANGIKMNRKLLELILIQVKQTKTKLNQI